MIELMLHGPVRGGKNNYIVTRQGRHIPRPEWSKWREGIMAQIAEKGPFITILTPCNVIFWYWKPDERKRDVPAMEDSLFHCLERAGIVADDSLFKSVAWIDMALDRANPRVKVEIKTISAPNNGIVKEA